MATVTRQPFAPLDGARLQTLTSLKNRQNAISAPVKRKAIDDDTENIDPIKRSKNSTAVFGKDILKDVLKKPSYHLTKKITTPACSLNSINPTARKVITPKSPSKKINTSVPLTAPAGRSPTRGKRSGILSSRRRTAGYTRVDPPSFNLGLNTLATPAPFSLDAALKGSIPTYSSKRTLDDTLNESEAKASWFFDIHEDTADQEMTNMLQHGTCVLDISSDEESERKASRDSREDKENIAPADDISQTRRARDVMMVEKERVSLGELNRTDFYGEGFDESSVFFIPDDEEPAPEEKPVKAFDFAPTLRDLSPTLVPLPDLDGDFSDAETEVADDIDILMAKKDAPIQVFVAKDEPKSVLQPMDGTGESFELWESGSAQDENEVPS